LNDHSYLLATIDGHGGGIAKYCRAPCPVSGGDDNAFALKQLYVLDSAQGNGLGRRLVSNLEDIARRAKANGIWLSVWESADWATGFYRSIGFEEIGKVDFKLGKATYTDSLMWMPLD
jgi:ribosomal protein S18 acetylase RimI-like enzyme